MAASYGTATQVGSYFVTQYYSILQHSPEYVHQLYSDSSTVVRIDGHTRETASAMLQIHALVMSTRFTSIEIKEAHSLESWNGGVIVMVTGSVQIKNLSRRKKFSQTFFLAPQEKGYFVLNDIFHFIEEDQVNPYTTSVMVQVNHNAKLSAPSPMPEAVPNYMMSGVMQARDYMPPSDIKENGSVDKFLVAEQRLQQPPEVESILEDNSREQANGFLESPIKPVRELPLAQMEELIEEPQKHTYASVLRAAKVQSAPSVASPSLSNKTVAPASEWQHISLQNNQQSAATPALEQSSSTQAENDLTSDMGEDVSAADDRGEIKSVYVRNLSPTVSASEIEEEFKKFGQLTGEGVAIRRLKDTDVCYAFVEYEDIASVQSAIKAGSVQISGRQVYIEERRANSSFARGRGRGRGRGTYQPDASRGRFGGRSYSRGGSQAGEREFNRSRGYGYYRQTTRQDRGYSGNQVRNDQSISE
ncbi:nuclear transport factor 2-like isoform X2 [Amaranthus tricolor]|uniref:nuclear transport factor 2-like isoform X2 n=1 Tax=Amaranthus tricolor TaxID=29722 RepID=UPI00258CCAE0|nr:nuclear transport factor 2-like isoform X2 [Amaranthus tricolor]